MWGGGGREDLQELRISKNWVPSEKIFDSLPRSIYRVDREKREEVLGIGGELHRLGLQG